MHVYFSLFFILIYFIKLLHAKTRLRNFMSQRRWRIRGGYD